MHGTQKHWRWNVLSNKIQKNFHWFTWKTVCCVCVRACALSLVWMHVYIVPSWIEEDERKKAEKVWAHCTVQRDSSISWSSPMLYFSKKKKKKMFSHTHALLFRPTWKPILSPLSLCTVSHASCIEGEHRGLTCHSSLVWMQNIEVDILLIFPTSNMRFVCDSNIKHGNNYQERRDDGNRRGKSNEHAEHCVFLKQTSLVCILSPFSVQLSLKTRAKSTCFHYSNNCLLFATCSMCVDESLQWGL